MQGTAARGVMSHRCVWLWLALGIVGHQGVRAQESLPSVVITGSHLPASAAQSSAPVQVITRRDIERSGAASTAELMAQVAANQPYRTEAMTAGGYGPAAFAGVNLRGLGEANTLLLVNGRRIAAHSGTGLSGAASDVDAIPMAAIDRIEILKDGASAIYGADAIGGVVNIILRRDVRGIELQAEGGRTSGGGAGRRSVALSAGGEATDGSLRWTGALTWRQEKSLPSRQRHFARSAYVPGLINALSYGTSPAGIWDASGNVLNPAYPGCNPPQTIPDPDGAPACWFDYATTVDLVPRTDRFNGVLRLEGDLSAEWRWYAEGMASRMRQQAATSPAYISGMDPATGTALYPYIGTSSPFYPTAFAAANGVSGDLTLDWRLADQGPRVDRHLGEQQRWLAGMQGDAGAWSFDSALVFTRHRLTSSMAQGYYRYTDVQALLNAGVLDPFGPTSPAAQAALDGIALHDRYAQYRTTSQTVDWRASRPLWTMTGGDAALALGGEIRRETLSVDFSDDAQTCVIAGGQCGGYDIGQARRAQALFGELSLPIGASLEARLALRHDAYGVGGRATTPKAALRWRMTPDVTWRTSFGRGFIAPSLEQLYAPSAFSTAAGGPFDDTARCGSTGSAFDCQVEFAARGGGSTGLAPEKSDQFGLGMVLGNGPRWAATIDAWAVHKKHRIGFVPASTIFADLPQYEALGFVTRYDPLNLPTGATCLPGPSGPVCPIQYVDSRYRNLGRQKTAGLDLGSRWRSTPLPWGVVTVTADGTWVQQFKTQVSSISPYVDQLGRYALDFAVPRWRHTLQVNVSQGPWSWTLGQRYVSSYVDYNPDPATIADRRVSAQSLWDAQLAYRLDATAILTVGARNLFAANPPASRQQNSFQAGYDPHFADPRGRVMYLRANLRF